MLKNPFSENEAPAIIVFGEQFFPDGVIGIPLIPETRYALANVFNPGFRFGTADDLVYTAAQAAALGDPLLENQARVPFEGEGGPIPGVAIPGQSLIDGFTLSGSKAGGGIYIFTRARGLQVSNNNVTNNQGNYAGGISVGVPDAGFQMYDEDDFRERTAGFQNTDTAIIYNKVNRNSGLQGAGGIAVSEDSKNYLVKDNIIIGNFSRFHGGGIVHIGRSDGEAAVPMLAPDPAPHWDLGVEGGSAGQVLQPQNSILSALSGTPDGVTYNGANLTESLVQLDFDDGPRPAGSGFDIGADEYLSAGLLNTCTGDAENDGDVDGTDLAAATDPAVIAADFGRADCFK